MICSMRWKSDNRAAEINKLLVECNFPSICIHSGMSQEERVLILVLGQRFGHFFSELFFSFHLVLSCFKSEIASGKSDPSFASSIIAKYVSVPCDLVILSKSLHCIYF
ncbi:hypothetical protein ACS0TY_019324 [Phlomoides rotata]